MSTTTSMTTTTSTTSGPARTAGRSLLARAARWWPILLALALTAATWGISTATAGRVLPLLPFLYVVAAVVQRRSATWPILGICLLGWLALRQQDLVDPTAVVVAVAAAITLGGLLLRGSGRKELLLQAAGMVVFTGIALVGLSVAPQIARYVLAAGWLAHGLWDLWHMRRQAVVSRSYAQWCGVVDIVMAAELLLWA